jgi:hypothetical protein
MKKKYEKPEHITGTLEKLVKSEKKSGEYLGNSDYYVMSLKLKDNDRLYEYNLAERESFEFVVGDELFFRSSNFNDKNKIAHKSLGKKIKPEAGFTISEDLMEILRIKEEQAAKKPVINKIKPH